MDGQIYRWTDKWMDRYTNGQINGWTVYRCTDKWMDR